MKYVINNQVVLSQPPEGPIAPYIASFARSVSEQGYSLGSLGKQVRIAVGFSRWLKQKGINASSIRTSHLTRYLRYRARHVRPQRGDIAALKRLIDFLRGNGVIPPEKVSPCRQTPVQRCIQAYEQYLRETRVLARTTIINYIPFVRDFLNDCFGDGQTTLSRLRASDVIRFVQRQAPRLHLKRAKLMTSALRSFLQYVRYHGDITLDLGAAVPIVANWSMTSIPRGIEVDQVSQLLRSIDRTTAVGRRDYAILLLLARLGLRSSEVAFLELNDIDWDTGQLHVGSKRSRRHELPLPAEVGKAIVAYLRAGRPHTKSRRVFLRTRAPICGFQGACGIGSIVRHSLQRAGVNSPTKGTHQFRHGLATEMLRQGASLHDIGDVLGHRHPQTTKIYTKVDLKTLRTLALPWPGGVR